MKRIVLILAVFGVLFGLITTPANAAGSEVMLLIDTSGSMQGDRITAAKVAARKAIDELPSKVAVGIVDFDSTVRTLVEPTTDRAELEQAISQLNASGSTALYDSIVTTAKRSSPGTVMVVLSDGEDTASAASVTESIAAANRAGVPVNIIGLELDASEKATAKQIAERTGGVTLSAENVAALEPAFAQVVTRSAVPTSHVPAPTIGDHARAALIFGLFIFASLFLFIAAFMYWRRNRKETQHRQDVLAAYGLSDSVLQRPQPIVNVRAPRFAKLSLKLERAGMTTSAERWLTIWTAVSVAAAVVVFAMTGAWFLALVSLPVVGWLVPRTIVKARSNRRVTSFGVDLPIFFREIASALRSGLSFSQALESVAGDGETEMSRQIRRAIAEIRMGSTIDAALMRVADRMESADMRWAVTALTIQREVGGNLAEILDTAARTMKERAEISREVRTLSAEGRLSAIILIMLPIGLFAFLFLTRREYIQVFWTTPIGWLMLITIGILVSVGWLWMRKTMKIEV